jgi:hypothetical protein
MINEITNDGIAWLKKAYFKALPLFSSEIVLIQKILHCFMSRMWVLYRIGQYVLKWLQWIRTGVD